MAKGFQFLTPQIGGGVDLGSILKLAGYGESNTDASNYIQLMKYLSEQGLGQVKEKREGKRVEAEITNEQLKTQIALADLQRKLAETQQGGQKTDIDAMIELTKNPLDAVTAERARKALAQKIPALKEQAEQETKQARGKRARDITDQLAAVYAKGDPKALNTMMLGLTGELEQSPELTGEIPWQKLNERWSGAPTTSGKAAQPIVPPQTPGADNWSYVGGRQKVPAESVPTATQAPQTQPQPQPPQVAEAEPGLLSRLTSPEGVGIADLLNLHNRQLAPQIDARNLPSAWEHQIPEAAQFMAPEDRTRALATMPEAAYRALGLETPTETRGRIESDPRYQPAGLQDILNLILPGRGGPAAVGQGGAWEHQIPQASEFQRPEEELISAVQPGEYQPGAGFPRQPVAGSAPEGPQWTVQDLLSKFMMDKSEQERLPWTYGPWNPPTGGGVASPVGGLNIDPRLLGQPTPVFSGR